MFLKEIAEGVLADEMKVKISELKQEKEKLEHLLERKDDKYAKFKNQSIDFVGTLKAKIANPENLKADDVVGLRSELQGVVNGITLHPHKDGYLEAELESDYTRLLERITAGRGLSLVAGVGFEPTTFRL